MTILMGSMKVLPVFYYIGWKKAICGCETVSYLLSVDIPINGADNLVVPDFDEKISFNGLTDYVNHLLTAGSYQEGILVKYFNENPCVKGTLPIRTSVLVLMAYYFSSCDIFEEPEYK